MLMIKLPFAPVLQDMCHVPFFSWVLQNQFVSTLLHQCQEMCQLILNTRSSGKELFGPWCLKFLLVPRAVNSLGCWKQKSSSCGALQASAWVVPAVNECLVSGLQGGDFPLVCVNWAEFIPALLLHEHPSALRCIGLKVSMMQTSRTFQVLV